MPRTKLPIPETFSFAAEMPVRITDINYGNHVGNDAMLGILHEARLRYLGKYGFSEISIGDETGLIMSDITVIFKSQAKYGDILKIEVLAAEPERFGFDLYYRVSKIQDGSEISRAKSSMVAFDYARGKIAPLPESFKTVMGL